MQYILLLLGVVIMIMMISAIQMVLVIEGQGIAMTVMALEIVTTIVQEIETCMTENIGMVSHAIKVSTLVGFMLGY